MPSRPHTTRPLVRVLAAALALAAAAPAAAQAERRLIVSFEPGASATERSAALRDVRGQRLRTLRAPSSAVVTVADAAAQARLARDPDVRRVEVDRPVRAFAAPPNDRDFGLLWGLRNTGQTVSGVPGTVGEDVRALAAWDTSRGAGAVVAVLDTGSDLAISDLAANVWTNPGEIAGNGLDDDRNGRVDDVRGWNHVLETADLTDVDGHGSHVAGTLLARADNGSGIAGVAPEAKLMTLKVLDDTGAGFMSDIAEGFRYAAEHGAKVVNASLGGATPTDDLRDAIAAHPGVLLVAAAGNDQADVDLTPEYPCAYDLPNVVCVAAHDNTGGFATGFSNQGKLSVDLAAPGVGIRSFEPGGKRVWLSGTSMATPHVAGAAALAVDAVPTATPSEVREALVATAREGMTLAGTSVSGGALDAAQLLAALQPTSPPVVVAPPVVTGDLVVGGTLTVSGGTFTAAATKTRRWEACIEAALDCRAVGGTTTQLVLDETHLGQNVRVTVTATNARGSTPQTSALVGPVGPRPAAVAGGTPVDDPPQNPPAMPAPAPPPPVEEEPPLLLVEELAPALAPLVVVEAVTPPALPLLPLGTVASAPVATPLLALGRTTLGRRAGRLVLRAAGTAGRRGVLTFRICSRDRRCTMARRTVARGRWSATLPLALRAQRRPLSVRVTLSASRLSRTLVTARRTLR